MGVRRLYNIQSEPGEGSGEQMSSTDQVLQVDSVNTQSTNQEPGVRLRTYSTFVKDNAPGNPLRDQVSRTEEPSALAKKSKGKLVVEESSKGNWIEKCECMAKRSGVGVHSTILGLIEVQRHGTEEIDRLTMLLAQGEAYLALLKAEQTTTGTSWEPGAMLALQNKNALLREENCALKKHVEDLAQQLLCDLDAANARFDKLLSRI
ncbi:hypothetical protein HAX54_047282 [Datura stramonium]|uniref:Uncharacterized protein n=1 Tax=Datura stramonium TaxID=4076 RepID=A0ABS8WLT5_DATST|nr:hypothetical protein [Datura stramonium]